MNLTIQPPFSTPDAIAILSLIFAINTLYFNSVWPIFSHVLAIPVPASEKKSEHKKLRQQIGDKLKSVLFPFFLIQLFLVYLIHPVLYWIVVNSQVKLFLFDVVRTLFFCLGLALVVLTVLTGIKVRLVCQHKGKFNGGDH